MSLYNSIFGYNPYAGLIVLDIFGAIDAECTNEEFVERYKECAQKIPRFRDAYFNQEKKLVLYTRTGGGNRAYYQSRKAGVNDDLEAMTNDELCQLPGFIGQEDDPFDSTFCKFIFEPKTQKVKDFIATTPEPMYITEEPHVRLQKVIEAMKSPESQQNNPDVIRAMEVGKSLAGRIQEAIESKDNNNVKIIET